jgi:hypothetical protein
MSYSVTDGSSLDADGAANGVIVDPAGPGVAGAVTAPDTGLQGVNNMLGTVSLGIGLFTAGYMIRRRTVGR